MTEKNGTSVAKVIRPEAEPNMKAMERFPSDIRLTHKVGSARKCLQKHEVYWERVSTEEDAQRRYGVPLQDIIDKGILQYMTGPAYELLFNKDVEPTITPDPSNPDKPFVDYPLIEDGHDQLQLSADNFKPGQKSERSTAAKVEKVKAAKFDTLNGTLALMGIDEVQIAACGNDRIKLATLLSKAAKETAKKARQNG